MHEHVQIEVALVNITHSRSLGQHFPYHIEKKKEKKSLFLNKKKLKFYELISS